LYLLLLINAFIQLQIGLYKCWWRGSVISMSVSAPYLWLTSGDHFVGKLSAIGSTAGNTWPQFWGPQLVGVVNFMCCI